MDGLKIMFKSWSLLVLTSRRVDGEPNPECFIPVGLVAVLARYARFCDSTLPDLVITSLDGNYVKTITSLFVIVKG